MKQIRTEERFEDEHVVCILRRGELEKTAKSRTEVSLFKKGASMGNGEWHGSLEEIEKLGTAVSEILRHVHGQEPSLSQMPGELGQATDTDESLAFNNAWRETEARSGKWLKTLTATDAAFIGWKLHQFEEEKKRRPAASVFNDVYLTYTTALDDTQKAIVEAFEKVRREAYPDEQVDRLGELISQAFSTLNANARRIRQPAGSDDILLPVSGTVHAQGIELANDIVVKVNDGDTISGKSGRLYGSDAWSGNPFKLAQLVLKIFGGTAVDLPPESPL